MYGLQAQYPEDVPGEHSQKVVEELATEYLNAMHEANAKGPYQFIGMCRGAHIALEMALRLEEQGQKVAREFYRRLTLRHPSASPICGRAALTGLQKIIESWRMRFGEQRPSVETRPATGILPEFCQRAEQTRFRQAATSSAPSGSKRSGPSQGAHSSAGGVCQSQCLICGIQPRIQCEGGC